LKPLGAEPDPAMRGSLVHRAVHDFASAFPDALPDDIEGELIKLADGYFNELGGSPRVEAFWRPAFQLFARWFAATEPGRRAEITRTCTEMRGALDLPEEFRLTARADRIDIHTDGEATIYDYKTGSVPKPKHVDEMSSPQLPLEAAIAAAGGFADLGRLRVKGLRYIRASGRNDGGEDNEAANADAQTLAEKALEDLRKLVVKYADPETPYEVKRRRGPAFANAYRYDEYEHLARVKEWLTLDTEEER
jgi:ATP-dependent helicase/nuclease subunit B